MTDETVKAKMVDLAERVRALRMRKVAIQSELSERYESWKRLMDADENNLGETKFRVGEKDVDIQRPWPQGYAPRNKPPLNTVATLKREHFDGGDLCELLAERETVAEKLASIERQLKSAGLAAI